MLNELNETEQHYVIGVLCRHLWNADSRLDTEITTDILAKLLESPHRNAVIDHIKKFNRGDKLSTTS